MEQEPELQTGDDGRANRTSTHSPKWLTMAGLLSVAWLVYEATAQPALAAVVFCLKFGWDDWRIAVWLWRSDPNRGRSHACFWAYVAAGLWRVAITGTVLMFAIAAFLERPQPGR